MESFQKREQDYHDLQDELDSKYEIRSSMILLIRTIMIILF